MVMTPARLKNAQGDRTPSSAGRVAAPCGDCCLMLNKPEASPGSARHDDTVNRVRPERNSLRCKLILELRGFVPTARREFRASNFRIRRNCRNVRAILIFGVYIEAAGGDRLFMAGYPNCTQGCLRLLQAYNG
jgi:hypothetical protein